MLTYLVEIIGVILRAAGIVLVGATLLTLLHLSLPGVSPVLICTLIYTAWGIIPAAIRGQDSNLKKAQRSWQVIELFLTPLGALIAVWIYGWFSADTITADIAFRISAILCLTALVKYVYGFLGLGFSRPTQPRTTATRRR